MFGEVPAMINTKLSSLVREENGYTVLLSHRPELFENYVSNGIDLVLSGHAHGGHEKEYSLCLHEAVLLFMFMRV